jgi:hypothetical protein
MVSVKTTNATTSWRSAEKNTSMRATPVIKQSFNRTGQDHIELVPYSVYALGIYLLVSGVCVSLFNVVKVISFSHVEVGIHAALSTCVVLLFAFLLTRLTLTGLARLHGLSSLVGLTMRLATNPA